MKWKKKDSVTTIPEVVMRNTGLTLEELKSPKENPHIKNLSEVAEYIIKLDRKTPVFIMGDYDCDGVTSSSIMFKALKALGFTDITVRLPKRFSEGYGLNENVIDEIKEGLLITVDNGISAHDAVKKAKSKGIDVIIIDHHIGDENNLPEADLIIDPNAMAGSEFTGYCGAGLCYRLTKELGVANNEMLALAAIGTVADVMALIQDNRRIVLDGLDAINKKLGGEGLNILMEFLDLELVTAKDIGFSIGPTVNASGRMLDDGAMIPFKLFSGSYTNIREARDLAHQMVELNQKRKEVSQIGMDKAEIIISEDCLFGDIPLLICGRKNLNFHEGTVGILAGRLAEKFHTPVFVLAETDAGELKGSCRSFGGVDVKALMDKSASFIKKYGGHEGAGGLTVEASQVEGLRNSLLSAMEGVEIQDPDEDFYDLEIKEEDIESVLEELKEFAPYGEGNPEIRFKITDFRLSPKNGSFSKEVGNGIKCFGRKAEAVTFNSDLRKKYYELKSPLNLNIYGTLSVNRWKTFVTNQVDVLDLEASDNSKSDTKLTSMLKEKMKEL